jgi:hypothetical protein
MGAGGVSEYVSLEYATIEDVLKMVKIAGRHCCLHHS